MKERLENKYFAIGLTIFSVAISCILFFFLIYRWDLLFKGFIDLIKILTPILYGLIFAYILRPVIKFFENKIFNKLGTKIFKDKEHGKKFSRFMSLFVSIIILLGIIIGFISFVIPELVNSLDILIKNIPGYFNSVKEFIGNKLSTNPDLKELLINNINSISDSILKWLNESAIPNMDTIILNISTGVLGIIKTIMNLIIGLIVAVYILNGKENFESQTKKVLYSILKIDRANIVLDNVRYIHKIFGGFLLGKIIDAMFVGIICFIFMYLFKLPYAVLISVIIAVTNIIPYFGPFIGAIPSALLILMTSPSKCITFIIFIFILQQIDGNIIEPKIIGGKTGLKSFWVLFAILVFGGLFGFVGMILGVPLFAIIYAFINGLCKRKLEKVDLPIKTSEYSNLKYIDAKTKKPIYFK